MSSKPFYSMEEVCEKLGKSPDDVKALVRDGALREFRDAGKVFFKAEDIEKLAGPGAPAAPPKPAGDTGEILLEATAAPEEKTGDEAATDDDLTTLADSTGGTSIIGLEPIPEEDAPKDKGEKKEDTVITASGIGVFDDDDLEIDADPMAKTQITAGASDDQVTLEGSGSGSGLLDLAREADDTALGADLLDEIYPGEDEAAEAPAEEAPAAAAAVEEPEAAAEQAPEDEEQAVLEDAGAGEVLVPVTTRVGDPLEGMFSGLLVGGLIVMAVACSVVAGVLQGFLPDYGRFLGDGSKLLFSLGGAVLLAVITLLIGWFIGKATGSRRR